MLINSLRRWSGLAHTAVMEQGCAPAPGHRFKEVDHESDASSSSSITWRQGSGNVSSAHSSPLRPGPSNGCSSNGAQRCVQACAQLCRLLDTIVAKEAAPVTLQARAAKAKAAAASAAGTSAAVYQDTLQDCSTLLQDLVHIQLQLQPRKRKRAGTLTDNYTRARQQQQQQQLQQRSAASILGPHHATPADAWQHHPDLCQPRSGGEGAAAAGSAAEEEEQEGWGEDELAPISSSASRGAWLKRCYKEIAESKSSALQRLQFAEAVREAHRTAALLLSGLSLGLADAGAHAFSKRHMLGLSQQLLRDVATLRVLAEPEPTE